MITIYVNWMDEEILTQKEMDKEREKLLDLTKESGKDKFEEFYEDEGYYKIEHLIEIITAENKQKAVDDLLTRYEMYIDNQLDSIYEKITLD